MKNQHSIASGARKTRVSRKHLGEVLIYGMLILGGILFLISFVFMILTSLKTVEQIETMPLRLWPDPVKWINYVEAFTVQPMGRYFLNSLIITVLNVLGAVFSCTLAGWGFSRPRFWGRDVLLFSSARSNDDAGSGDYDTALFDVQ